MEGQVDLAHDPAREAFAAFVRAAAGARAVRVHDVKRLRGGAIQENWCVDLEIQGGSPAGRHELVVRTDSPSRIPESHTRADEFAILKVAHEAGVSVPEPLWLCVDPQVIGRPFYVTRLVPGTAAGHKIVRDPTLGGPHEVLAERLGQELARIHGITPAGGRLDFLPLPDDDPGKALITHYRHALDQFPDAHPALEWGLRWCELNAPPRADLVLVHRDFRTGNYLVDEHGLAGILDWEFAGWGDPMEDVAWFCARCWRFGALDKEAGGIAPREPFYRGYESASGRRIDPRAVHYWEVMAHIRWAVIALHQTERHLSGEQSSLELALTGRIAGECELEVLLLTDQAEAGRV